MLNFVSKDHMTAYPMLDNVVQGERRQHRQQGPALGAERQRCRSARRCPGHADHAGPAARQRAGHQLPVSPRLTQAEHPRAAQSEAAGRAPTPGRGRPAQVAAAARRPARRRRRAGILLSLPADRVVVALLGHPDRAGRLLLDDQVERLTATWIGPSAYSTALQRPDVLAGAGEQRAAAAGDPVRDRHPAGHRGPAARARPRLAVLPLGVLPADGDLLGRHRHGRGAVLRATRGC